MPHHSVFFDFMIILGAATFLATLFHALKLPLIVGYLVAGAIVGPTGYGLISLEANPTLITEIAGVLLMFALGLEFSAQRLREWGKKLFKLGFPSVTLTVLVVTLVAHFGFQEPWAKAVFWGFLFSLSSTAVVIKLLEQRRDLESPHGNTTLSILLMQDLMVVPMLLSLRLLAGQVDTSVNEMDALKFVGKSLMVIFLMVIAARWILPHGLTRVAKTKSRELFFFSVAFLCFGLAVLFNEIGLSASLGAFFAGVIIAESQFGSQASNDFTVARDLFLGFFFTSLGMALDLNYFASNILSILLLFAGVSALKILLVGGIMRLQKYPSGISWLTAGILFQTGEFSFILAEQGAKLNLISKDNSQLFLSASLLSLAATPFVLQSLIKRVNRVGGLTKQPTPAPDYRDHVIIAGFGVAAKTVLKATKSHGIPSVVIDLNPDNRAKVLNMAEEKIFGDARQPEVWHEACAQTAKLAIITVSGQGMAAQVVKAARQVRRDLPLIVRTQYFRESTNHPELHGCEVIVAESEAAIEVTRKALLMLGTAEPEILARLQVLRTELKLNN